MDEHTKGRMSKRAHVKRHGVDKYKKFIGNQSEGQGFADNRKRKIQHEYLKILSKQRKKEEYETGQQLTNDKYTEEDSLRGKKFTKYSKSEWHSQQRKEEKARKKTEALRRKREREEALAKYNSKKQKKNKTFSKRTHKGQPVMKNQIEYLLTKIEKQVDKT
ncbi:thyroid transcription factor 1-associated protein 26-like [Ylistrum balloti]|uniref:thyroid transcription factor 1-associated protein 26-like n=1 Tax=Ylistrum balloti TaxID=509963 RepID=UPI002905BA4F|nr:thyroid transcription factor 1-associated protein 26-like [Ylistrum balloti]